MQRSKCRLTGISSKGGFKIQILFGLFMSTGKEGRVMGGRRVGGREGKP
jgi:hypothetical protein